MKTKEAHKHIKHPVNIATGCLTTTFRIIY